MKFVIPIVPTAQMRTASRAIQFADGTARGTVYKKAKQRSREETIKAFLARHPPEKTLGGALLLGVWAYLPIPKSKPNWFAGTNKEFQAMARDGTVRPITKPDFDNLMKQIKDCLTQCRYWKDDSRVVGYLPHVGKFYSDEPRWVVEVMELRPKLYQD